MYHRKARSILQKCRMEKNWSQKMLAQRVGTSIVSISKWENGVSQPQAFYLRKLCEIFEKRPEELLLSDPKTRRVSSPRQRSSLKKGQYQPNRLKEIRMKYYLTQEIVAEAVGTDRVNVSRWENGVTFPSVRFLTKLSQFFRLPISELFPEFAIWSSVEDLPPGE